MTTNMLKRYLHAERVLLTHSMPSTPIADPTPTPTADARPGRLTWRIGAVRQAYWQRFDERNPRRIAA